MDNTHELQQPSLGKSMLNFIVGGFLSIMGSIAILNGIFSLLHIWFGRFDGKGMKIGRNGQSLELMDDVPQSLFILGVGLFFWAIVRLRKQTRRQVWYRSHRLMFRIGLIIVMIPIGRGGYRGLVSMNGGNAIYAAQQCDTETIRELNDEGEIADTDKNEMMMRMAQKGCSETISYVLDQGWDVNTIYNNTPIVNTAGSFATATTIMALVDRGANVNSMDNDISLLMRVLQNSAILPEEKIYVVKTLIARGADVNYSTPSGLSVTQLATSAGIDLTSL